jgi:hypothetical protein
MRDVVGIAPNSKDEGLNSFAAQGFFLVDATYTPVNGLEDNERDATILRDFPLLVETLRKFSRLGTKIVLVKSNVCRLLETKLREIGFNVLNQGTKIPFPGSGQQSKFRAAICRVGKVLAW